MTNLLKIALLWVCVTPAFVNAQCAWQNIPSNATADLKAVHFPSNQEGWAVGTGGVVLHSATGGLIWSPQDAKTTNSLNSVHFANTTTGWVVGNKGVIRKTVDGGANWTTQVAGTGVDLYDVWFLNADTGWIVGACGLILRTVNGGTQWNQVNSGQTAHLFQVKVPNGSDGVVTTSISALLNTTNSGTAWPATAVTPRSFRAFDMEIGGTAFAASTTGNVLRSNNAGINWTNAATPTGGGAWQALSLTGNNTVYLAGLDGKLFKSTDGGGNWSTFNAGLGTTDIYGLFMHSDTLGWAVGEAGKIFLLKVPAPPIISGPSIVCGAPITLKATGGYATWRWSNTQTTQTITAILPGIYTVTATAAGGCTATATATVTAGTLPALTLNPVPATCERSNGGVNLTVSNIVGTSTYLWNNNATTQNLQNILAGTYTVTVTSGNGCSNTASTVVNGSALPVVAATPTAATCDRANGTVSLSGSFTGTPAFLWSNNAITQNLSAIVAGAYTVTVTSGNGCTATASATVMGTTAPTATVTPTVASCDQANGAVSLSVAGTTGTPTYFWSNSAVTQQLQAIAAGTYTVTVISGNGCTTTASTTVIGTAAPMATATPIAASCGQANGSVSLGVAGATGAPAYLWSNSATTQNLPAVAMGTYAVTVTSGNGCTGTAIAVVSGSTAPTATTTSTAANCGQADGSVSLTASNTIGATTYGWSNAATTQDLPAVTAGTYTVTVTSGNGCTTTASAIVGGGAVPTAAITATSDICNQSKGTVILTNLANIVGTPAYHWSNNATTQNLQNVAAGFYAVTITNGNGCTTTASATVTNVNDPPPANAGMPKGVCPGEAVALTATGGVDYKWSNGVVQNQSFVPTQTQTYTVTVTGSNACTATATVTVTVYPLPSIQISGPTALCMGSATLDAGSGFAYIWSSGETTQQITVTSPKLYTVTVTDGNGCTGTGTRTIGPNTTSLTPKISGPTALCDGVALLDAGSGYTDYAWSSGQSTQTISISTPKVYTVTVTGANGCTGTDTRTIGNSVVSPKPTITGPTSFCKGTVTLSAIGPYKNWEWSTGQNGVVNSISVNNPDTYSVTVRDANDCTGTASAVLTSADNTAPIIQFGLPANITVTCNNAPAPLPLPASDNCDDNVTTTGMPTDVVSGAPCGTRTIQRTWRAQDAAGNVAILLQTITLLDNVAPVITTNLPANITVTCGNLPAALPLSATDACDAGLTTTAPPTDNTSGLSACGTGQLIRTWKATDCTGNTAVRTQMIAVVDATAPVITGIVPPDAVVICGDPLPSKTTLPASDHCDGLVIATNMPVDNLSGLSACGTGTVLRVWRATDCNGNTATVSQRIAVIDNKAPVLVVPADVTVDCGSIPTATAANATATDNCDLAATITYEGEIPINPGGCLSQLRRTWKAVDCSGNTALLAQIVTVKDDKAPVFDKIPADAQICQGSVLPMVNLTWKDNCGGTGSVPGADVNNGMGITRTWRQTDACGNMGTAVQQIQIIPLPLANAGPNDTICAGQSVVLTASGGSQYAWSNNVQQGQPFFPTQTQTYTVTVTGAGACSATATATVTVNTIPSVNAVNNITVCAGQNIAPIVFSGTSGANFNWTNNNTNVGLPAGGTGDISAFAPPNPLVAQTATIVVTPKIGTCEGPPRQFTIQVNPSPTMNGLNDVSVCGGEPIASIVFSGTPGSIFEWTNSNTSIGLSAHGTGNIGGFMPPLQTTTQTSAVTVRPSVGGCLGEAHLFNIAVKANPQPQIDGASVLCNADTTTLDASGPYTDWRWSGGQTTAAIDIAAAGVYRVTVTDTNRCMGVASKTVSQLTGPAVAIAGNKQFCPNGSTTLSIDKQYVLTQWSTGSVAPTITVNSVGTYRITVTNANGCRGVDSVVVSQYAPPIAQLGLNEISGKMSNDSIICKGGKVYFTGHGGTLYQFFINGLPWGILDTKPYFEISTLQNGDIVSLWIQDNNGCEDTTLFGEPPARSPIKIQVEELPNWTGAQLSLQSSCKGEPVLLRMTCPNMPDGPYDIVYGLTGANNFLNKMASVGIQNSMGTLNLGPLPNAGATKFSMSAIRNAAGCERPLDGANSTIDFVNGSGIQTSLEKTICKNDAYFFCGENRTKTGSYPCKFVGAQGCDSTVVLTLTVVDTLKKNVSASICDGLTYDFYGKILTKAGNYKHYIDTNGCDTLVNLTLSVLGAFVPTNILKDTICPGQTVVVGNSKYDRAGTYVDTLQTITGCDSLVIVLILTELRPLALANLGPDIHLCNTTALTLNALTGSCNGCTYQWSAPGGTQPTLTVTPAAAASTDYWVTVKDSQGCTSSDSIRVVTLDGETVEIKKTVCDGESYAFCGRLYQRKGQYTCPSKDGRACDSLLILEVLSTSSFSTKPDMVSIQAGATMDVNVLANDTFAGKVSLSTAPPEKGKLEMLANNLLRYTANSGASGFDKIPYLVCSDSALNCKICVTDTLVVEIKAARTNFEIPNLFFPDGDNAKNKKFDPINILREKGEIQDNETVEMVIINRFGEVVVSPIVVSPMDSWDGWDGTRDGSGGKILPAGTYYYVLRIDGKTPYKGPITLLRPK